MYSIKRFSWKAFLVSAALLLVLVPEPGRSASRGPLSTERRALLVGINKYSPAYGPGDLRACVADAKGIRDIVLLGDPADRWAAKNIRLLTDSNATRNAIRSELNALAATSSQGDLVLYYHSGHGGQAAPNVTFLCAHDANYTDSELASDLAAFDAGVKIIVIIDACHSGGMFKSSGRIREWPFAERVMTEYRARKSMKMKSSGLAVPKSLGDNIAFMTACDYDEFSWETAEHGVYTGFLLEGCRIPAVDTNHDGEYQFMELHVYAEKNALASGYHQHAQSLNDTILRNTIARSVLKHPSGLNNDYNGNGASDLAVYHEATGSWFIWSLAGGLVAWGAEWGGPGLLPVVGDYNGDGTADLAVYHEDSGQWFIRSLTKGLIAWGLELGGEGWTPVAGDYSGNGVADLAVYNENSGYWMIASIKGNAIVAGKSWHGAGFTAVPGDYSGNGISDCAMYDKTTGFWEVVSVYGSTIITDTQWGGDGLMPVPGDYNGDGTSDMAVYCGSTGFWYIWSYKNSALLAWAAEWGGTGFVPVPGDYNGDGATDLAVYHQATGQWFIWSLTKGLIAWGLEWGGPGLVPVQSSW